MLPSVIPDSCLAGSGMTEKWTHMVVNAFKRVRIREEERRERSGERSGERRKHGEGGER